LGGIGGTAAARVMSSDPFYSLESGTQLGFVINRPYVAGEAPVPDDGAPQRVVREARGAQRLHDRVGGPADRALRRKYGWQYRVFELVEGLRGAQDELVFLEVCPPAGEEG